MDIFALIVLIILLLCGLAVWAAIGYFPGKIARDRHHPQADAISVCGWLGALTFGILAPLAFIWAYTNPEATLTGAPRSDAAPSGNPGRNSGGASS
jgi:hypothetical protein